MIRMFRFSPSRLALAYIVLSVLVLALFAIPLWYAWNVNISTFRVYVLGTEVQRMVDTFQSEGATGLAAAIDSQVAGLPDDEVMLLADASKTKLAGNLPAWPIEVPGSPGTYGLVLDSGDSSKRVVVSHVTLPGGYHLLIGRESARFQSLVDLFWFGIAGATGIALVLGAVIGWLIRRALLFEVREISRTASAIVEGGSAGRLAMRGSSSELDTLARTVNGMLEQLATQNVQLESEIAVRRQAEQALHRAHEDLEGLVAQRTAQLELANESLRRSEERFSLAIAGSSDGIWDWDILTGEMFYSERAQVLNGLEPGLAVRQRSEWRTMWKLHPYDVASQSRAIDDYVAGRAPAYDGEWRVRQLDGTYRWVHGRGLCVRDETGRATRMIGAISDIHARKCAEEALRFSEQRYALAMEASGEGHWDWNVATDEFYADPRMLELYGFPPGTSFAGRLDFLARLPLHPADRPKWEAAAAAHFAGTAARLDMEIRILRRGETLWIHLTGLVKRNAAGEPTRWTGSVADVTDRRAAEDALRLSEHRYALAMEATGDGHWDWNIPADKMYVSPLLLEMCGLATDITFASRSEWVDRFPFYPGERARYEQAVAEHFAGKTARLDAELRIVPRGETRWIHMTGHCARDASGTPVRWAGSVTDVTARKRVEEELRARQQMLDLAQKAARAVAFEWWIGAGEGENRWSPDLEAMYGIAPGSYDGTYESWKELVHMEDWPNVSAAIKAAQESGDVAAEYRVAHKGGAIRWLQAKGRMFFDPEGKPSRVVGFMLDVTDRHLAEEELQRMEHQLRQAQRLEAMGTLAGGIAHDFNNLLGAILGYGEMAMRDAPAGSRLRRDLDSIMIAGERGRALVDRILAFSRSGVGERVPVNVEDVVRETLGLFAAKLPNGIALEDRLRAGRAAVMGDATQIHQVLMNLVTNAMQAMPSGGTLRVSLDRARVDLPRAATTGTVAAGEYVVLQVADTGSGIPPETLERIFDPFFTTKEVGVGSGLGLSLVHGIVTGLGGAIDVATTVGKGSVFTVYLPRAGDVTSVGEPKRRAQPSTRRGERQRVLVVDDEESLVRLATQTLTELGYSPVGFTASATAIEAFLADPQRFDAVITDESMPGTSGSELIRKLRSIRPKIPIVLVSGYLNPAVVQRAREAGADEVLKKPLSARELAMSLARVLESRAEHAPNITLSPGEAAAKAMSPAHASPPRAAPARRRKTAAPRA
ncbi:MAG TPA: PAS domain-containing protein [Casimicrobiaceae bacterium]|jgi:PAS domain S-box-containing protein|nr:PAS domain-containing protein [Casimicrobiaceae bacterium]